ncbi:cytochrome c maturation protein CcmE [Pleionea litopenaei]|uniref:Cytochrome c-type biogenesis protein CcmE n=1 Tax=Pleionea litopenaei TaxID=3070815 RepID=A0AA51RVD7_9GAMM|nr:cytochrome c maturation protein CcmE [Pleionea sp. HL-JVS1]WMS88153.1 cytochrome c maturation protein CcmE [Pleionea sp. HL-JVS1]
MMKPHRKKRLIAVLATVCGAAIAVSLVLMALNQNINLFYTPAQIKAGEAPFDKSIKVGGLVVPGSVKRGSNPLDVEFTIRDKSESLVVKFSDVLPDLFKEGQGIVATGKLVDDKQFVASSVLAKHDENYMPPEVARALEEGGHPIKNNDFDKN